MQQGPLMPSSNPGRFAVCVSGFASNGMYPDLTAGMLIEVFLGGHWVQGSVEFAAVYVAPLDNTMGGYYFRARDHSVVGLCAGTEVRIQN